MKLKSLILALALVAAPVASYADGPSLIVLGKSFHFGGTYSHGLNGNNPGLGLEYAKGDWFAGGLTYYDSFRKQAYAAYVGYRYPVSIGQDLTAFASLRVGYINGSGMHGPMALPTIGLQYKHASIEMMYIPKVSPTTVNVIGLFGRWEF